MSEKAVFEREINTDMPSCFCNFIFLIFLYLLNYFIKVDFVYFLHGAICKKTSHKVKTVTPIERITELERDWLVGRTHIDVDMVGLTH